MKKNTVITFSVLIISFLLILVSCSKETKTSDETKKSEETDQITTSADIYTIDSDDDTIPCETPDSESDSESSSESAGESKKADKSDKSEEAETEKKTVDNDTADVTKSNDEKPDDEENRYEEATEKSDDTTKKSSVTTKKSAVTTKKTADTTKKAATTTKKTADTTKKTATTTKKIVVTTSAQNEEPLDEPDYPQVDGVPAVYLTGNVAGCGKDKYVTIQTNFVSDDLCFESYATIEVQGATSASYPKKNYNIRLYTDKSCTKKNKIEIVDGWGKESKYTLKANYMDYTMARNNVSANLWGQMVHCRANVNPIMNELVNGGAIDGFPVMVYINNRYNGVYTFNIPKDQWMFGIGDGEKEAVLFTSSGYPSECFNGYASLAEDSRWDVVYCSTEDTTWAENSLNQLISFTMNNDGEDFRNGISKYLDVDATIDYMLYMYTMHASDNRAKNMLWVTYDGVKWIPSFYDMDATWGIDWTGRYVYADYEGLFVTPETGAIKSCYDHLLWDRMLNCFADKVSARFKYLRETVLSEENIMNEFRSFMNLIPDELYEKERQLYTGIPSLYTTSYEQIYSYVKNHIPYLDFKFDYITQIPGGNNMDYSKYQ